MPCYCWPFQKDIWRRWLELFCTWAARGCPGCCQCPPRWLFWSGGRSTDKFHVCWVSTSAQGVDLRVRVHVRETISLVLRVEWEHVTLVWPVLISLGPYLQLQRRVESDGNFVNDRCYYVIMNIFITAIVIILSLLIFNLERCRFGQTQSTEQGKEKRQRSGHDRPGKW